MGIKGNIEYYEQAFDILKNSEGDILVAVSSLGGTVNNPQMYYDGKDRMILRKCEDWFVILPEINEDIRVQLLSVQELLFVEIEGEIDSEEYVVPIIEVDSIDDFIESLKSK